MKCTASICFAFILVIASGCADSNSSSPSSEIRQNLQRIVEDSLVPTESQGVVINITTPLWTWSSAAGQASLLPEISAEPGMNLRIASVSKTYVAAAIMKLAEQGRLSIDDPIGKWIGPEYLAYIHDSGMITLRMLLEHRSGLNDYDEMEEMIPLQLAQPDTPVSTRESILSGLERPAFFPPNEGWMYSNVNFLLLGLVIDAASGESYEGYMQHEILAPAGLSNTYMMTSPPVREIPQPFMHCILQTSPGVWFDYSTLYVNWDRGAGDIAATIDDLAHFHKALRDGVIIRRSSYEEMAKAVSPMGEVNLLSSLPGSASEYGLGYVKASSPADGVTFLGHAGGYPGSTTLMFYWVEADTYITLNVNAHGVMLDKYLLMPVVKYLQGADTARQLPA